MDLPDQAAGDQVPKIVAIFFGDQKIVFGFAAAEKHSAQGFFVVNRRQ